jgi:2-isopropylmalate synthase
VAIRLEKGGRIVNGYGADTDIVVASAKAYLSALNRIMVEKNRLIPDTGEV